MAVGFWAVLGAQALLLVASLFGASLAVASGARLTIVIGVVAAVGAFLANDRD